MKVVFSERAWVEYLSWQQDDPKLLARINALVRECMRHPFQGTGKPEPLKGDLTGWWTRRISGEHRLVHRVSGTSAHQSLEIAQCRFHYR
ncbi:MAG TPA: Txe/YoeB family addiction module toxin [Thermohalobaculum sp.]|nr:Txe/YoeB family addiction module toxin [Thermohalobaculum sp.]